MESGNSLLGEVDEKCLGLLGIRSAGMQIVRNQREDADICPAMGAIMNRAIPVASQDALHFRWSGHIFAHEPIDIKGPDRDCLLYTSRCV